MVRVGFLGGFTVSVSHSPHSPLQTPSCSESSKILFDTGHRVCNAWSVLLLVPLLAFVD